MDVKNPLQVLITLGRETNLGIKSQLVEQFHRKTEKSEPFGLALMSSEQPPDPAPVTPLGGSAGGCSDDVPSDGSSNQYSRPYGPNCDHTRCMVKTCFALKRARVNTQLGWLLSNARHLRIIEDAR